MLTDGKPSLTMKALSSALMEIRLVETPKAIPGSPMFTALTEIEGAVTVHFPEHRMRSPERVTDCVALTFFALSRLIYRSLNGEDVPPFLSVTFVPENVSEPVEVSSMS